MESLISFLISILDREIRSLCNCFESIRLYFIISAKPHEISLLGKDFKKSDEINTFLGRLKVPIKFLPNLLLIPVLPPMALSAMAKREVGIIICSMPLIIVEAKKPERSPIVPPPNE